LGDLIGRAPIVTEIVFRYERALSDENGICPKLKEGRMMKKRRMRFMEISISG
jgi:hypothetical protein